MTLALLIYSISLLEGIAKILVVSMGVLLIYIIGGNAYYYLENIDHDPFKKKLNMCVVALTILAVISVIIPSKQVVYMMVGAYAAQKVAEDPRSKEVGDKVLKLINQKLDEQLEEEVKKAIK